jgi:2'-5' RNA ligase
MEAHKVAGMKALPAKGAIVLLPGGQRATVEYSSPHEKVPVLKVRLDDGKAIRYTRQKDIDALQSTEPTTYKFGSTQANIPHDSPAAKGLGIARSIISKDDLMGDGIDVGGNHVTVRYGIKGEDVEGVKKYLASLSPFEASLGSTEIFPPSEHSDGAAVIHAPIEAPELHQINAELEKHGDFTEPSFDEYKPHATVAYVKPERAHRYLAMNITKGQKFQVNEIAITDRQGNQQVVKLKGKASPSAGRGISRGFQKPEMEAHKVAGMKAAAEAPNTPDHLRPHLRAAAGATLPAKGAIVLLPGGQRAAVEYSSPHEKVPVLKVRLDDGKAIRYTRQKDIDALQVVKK